MGQLDIYPSAARKARWVLGSRLHAEEGIYRQKGFHALWGRSANTGVNSNFFDSSEHRVIKNLTIAADVTKDVKVEDVVRIACKVFETIDGEEKGSTWIHIPGLIGHVDVI